MNKINILIISYNTPKLIHYNIKSINKFTPNANIYVFDNSNRRPFVNSEWSKGFDNVTIFDNTNRKILPRLINVNTKLCGSADHTYAVNKCFELIPDGFILLDSDVIVKQDLNKLIDNTKIFVGDIIHNRIKPWCVYINVPMCIQYNIKFFYEDKMMGIGKYYNSVAWETGQAFYEHASKYPHTITTVDGTYVSHKCGASWVEFTVKNYNPETANDNFINVNKKYWE